MNVKMSHVVLVLCIAVFVLSLVGSMTLEAVRRINKLEARVTALEAKQTTSSGKHAGAEAIMYDKAIMCDEGLIMCDREPHDMIFTVGRETGPLETVNEQ